MSSARRVCWDLSDLYAGPADPAVDGDLAEAARGAKEFETAFRGRIAGGQAEPLDAAGLCGAIEQYERIAETIGKAANFAHLLHAADSRTPEHGALLQSIQARATDIRQHLIFFELEWMDCEDARAEALIADPALERYRHFLAHARRYRPHRLSEPEELLLDQVANTGCRAWQRLFDELTSSATFRVRRKGHTRQHTQSEVLAMLYSPDRPTRQAAAAGLTRGLRDSSAVLSYVFNTLVWDHEIGDRLRRYPDPMASRHLDNEIDADTVEALMTACEAGHPLVQRYYRLKGRLLGIDDLKDYDRYAPVAPEMPACDFGTCRQTILDAYGQFSDRMRSIAAEFFEKRWIDAAPRPGKRGGAFSASTVPSVHPYILCNYTDTLRDVMTVAHELGHGVHQYLSRQAGYLQAHTPLTLAETASVFGEMLTFHHMLPAQPDPRVRLGLLCGKIEDAFATVFRQVVLTRFEQTLHAKRRGQGELTVEEISELWMEANRPMHGDAVELTDDYGWWWLYIGHFVHSPFYCYAYAFGELLVLALYAMYQSQGEAFVPAYLELLGRGGSASPDELLAPLGVDVRRPDFWQQGIGLIDRMVAQAETLAGEVA